MFVPLAHPPGHAQADFGEADAIIAGVKRRAHFFAMDLPHSDACFVAAYPAAATEAWLDGHNGAFAFFGGIPQSILYDQVDRHIEVHDSMESLAEELDMKVAGISDYPDWRRENDRLIAAGETILLDMETHGPHLDNILIGETRMKWALLNMSRAIRRDDEAISEEAIAAEKLLAQPETPEEREQRADLEILKFRRHQSAVDDAATQEEREAALKEFDDYVERHVAPGTLPPCAGAGAGRAGAHPDPRRTCPT